MEKESIAADRQQVRKNVSIKVNKNFSIKLKTESGLESVKNRPRKYESIKEGNRTLAAIDDRSFAKKNNPKNHLSIV